MSNSISIYYHPLLLPLSIRQIQSLLITSSLMKLSELILKWMEKYANPEKKKLLFTDRWKDIKNASIESSLSVNKFLHYRPFRI
uniref:Uncharacterized protein n=1 Tax=Onchocerca volvulus TaxID=6282 RepID=A0A8R1TW81_ONCVO